MSAPGSVLLNTGREGRGSSNGGGRTPDSEQHRQNLEAPNNRIEFTVERPEESPEGSDRTPSGSEDLFLNLAKDNGLGHDAEEELKRKERRRVSIRVRSAAYPLHNSASLI